MGAHKDLIEDLVCESAQLAAMTKAFLKSAHSQALPTDLRQFMAEHHDRTLKAIDAIAPSPEGFMADNLLVKPE